MQILTQKQAHKRYPKRGYNKYSPMLLLVGQRKEFMRGVITAEYRVHREEVITLPVKFDPDCCQEPEGMSIDVSGPKPTSICRVVIWK